MNTVLWLLAAQGVLGAFDTLYYHEWRARLPALEPAGRLELRLHALRDFVYAILFTTLPWLAWQGGWAVVLALLVASEIAITLADFAIEDRVRKPLGGVYPGERTTHTIMAIVYGAMLGYLVPAALRWWREPTAIAFQPIEAAALLKWAVTLMGAGVFLSGLRDIVAAVRMVRRNPPR